MSNLERISIRTMKKSESPAVRTLINRSFPLLQRLFVSLRGRDILVAHQGDQILGGVVLKTFYIPGRGKGGLVEWIFCAPEARGRGAGESLLDAALKFFKKKSAAEIFAIIEGNNTSSTNIFASRDFSPLSPGEQLRRYRFSLPLVWLYTFHYIDVSHFLWARPAASRRDCPLGQWIGNLLVSALIALLAWWRIGGFTALKTEALLAVPLSFLAIFGVREAVMRLAAKFQGLPVRYRVWESGLFFNLLLALFFGWFFPVPGNIYPREEGWKYRERARSLGVIALAGALAVVLLAWAVPLYRLLLGGVPDETLSTFATLAFMVAFFDIALPFFPFSGYNGRRLWDWNIFGWVIPAVMVALLFVL
jgi:GNAT superfamily N-acetyltransferase